RPNERRTQPPICAPHSNRPLGPPCYRSFNQRLARLYPLPAPRPAPPPCAPHSFPSAASSPLHLPAGHGELWAPPDSGSSTSGSYVVSCTDARPSPSPHFLPSAASSPVAPACWPQGKILPPSTPRLSRYSSPQAGRPQAKITHACPPLSRPGTRRELWAPPDSGSSSIGS